MQDELGFPLPIRSTRSSLIKQAIVDGSQEWSGWFTLLEIAPASYPKIFDMSKNSSRDREVVVVGLRLVVEESCGDRVLSSSGREKVVYSSWSSLVGEFGRWG